MQLAIALAIIASVLLPNHEVELSRDSLGMRAACSLLVSMIPLLFARSFSRCIATRNVETPTFIRSLRQFERLFIVVWICATAILLGIFRWDLCVRGCWPVGESVLLSQLAIFIPILGPVITYWSIVAATEDRHIRALHDANHGDDQQPTSFNWTDNLSVVWIQTRQMILLPAIPVMVILLVDDTLTLIPTASQYRVFLFGILVAMLPFVLPLILRQLWRLESLDDGETRERIQSLIDRIEVKVSDICLWRTGNRCVNAAVAGAFRRSRILLITDALLDSFSPTELDAVVAHEMAHVKHRHVPTMLWSLVAAGLTAVMCSQIIEQNSWNALSTEQTSLLILVPILATWLLLHRFISRSFEYQADLVACKHLSELNDSASPANSPESSFTSFVGMLQKLAPVGATGSDWWHPSITSRIATLREIKGNPERQRAFEARITAIDRMVRGTVVFLALVTIGLALIRL